MNHSKQSGRQWMVRLGFLVLFAFLVPAAGAQGLVDDTALSSPGDGADWPEFGNRFNEQRYSPLDAINRDSVKRLGLAWSLDLPDVWNVSSAPVEVDGVIYIAVGYSIVKAIDARTGALLWSYDPKVDPVKMRMAWGIRGLAFYKGHVYAGVQDGRLFALDAKTGSLVWETQTVTPGDNRYITGAPRVFGGRVIIGHGGADFGNVRGYVTAYDAETGKQDWRFFIVPGNPADGFENKAMEVAAKTWTGEWWKLGGGGTAWNAMTYDPEFDRIYIGTGNGGPWNAKLRSPGGGDNLYLCSVVALDAKTGEYVWHYQTTPGESWDFNSTMDMIAATVDIDGKPRKVLLHAPKNGFFYVIDRENGKLISAEKFAKVTWAKEVDKTTGRPVEYPGVRYETGESLMWPGSGGGHNWQPMAYSPETKAVYIPAHELPGYYDDRGFTPATWSPERDGPLGIHAFFDDVPKNGGSSSLLAWDPVAQKKLWSVETPGATNGGVMVTKAGLVFQGQADGRFVAHDAATGAALWTFDMGVGTQAPPITYSVDGKQYVAVLSGWAGGAMLLGSLSAQHGWVGRDHPRRLLVFALDGKAQLPATPPPSIPEPIHDAGFKVDPALALKGQTLYGKNCTICHGVAAVAGGFAPDLRASPIPLQLPAFSAIVKDGALVQKGMPPFAELSPEDLAAIQHYIRQRADYVPTTWEKVRQAFHFIGLMIHMQLERWGL